MASVGDNLNIFLVLPSLLFSLLVVFVIKFLWQYRNLRATLNKIPGPKDVFLFGNALQMERISHREFLLYGCITTNRQL